MAATSLSEKKYTAVGQQDTYDDEAQMAEAPSRVDLDWRKDAGLVQESRWGGTVDFVDGFVEGFQLDAMLRGGFFKVQAPVFSDPFVKQQTMFVVGMTLVVAATFVVLDRSAVLPLDAAIAAQAASVFAYFSGLSSLLFGYFVFNQLSAFLAVKTGYLDGFMSAFGDLVCLVSVWLPGTDAPTAVVKQTLVRWGLAAFALMCGTASPEGSGPDATAHCVARGLLSAPEALLVAAHHHDATTPLLWMHAALEAQLLGTPGEGFKRYKAQDKLLAMKNNLGGVLTAVSPFGNQPLPLVHLMSALVKIQLFLLGVSQGVAIASVVLGSSSGKAVQIGFSLAMAVATPVIYQGLLEFVVMIRNPFGRDWLDLPTRLFHAQCRDECLQCVQVGEAAAALPTVQAAKLA